MAGVLRRSQRRAEYGVTMEIPKFDEWCTRAVKEIRHREDRARVFRELREHMEDHYDDAMSRGLVHWKAVEETLEAMGDPKELAPMLAAQHPPGWGRGMDLIRGLCIYFLAHVIALTLFPSWEANPAFQPDTELWFHSSVNGSGETRTMLLHPGVSAAEGDFTLTVTDVAQWYTNYGGYPKQEEWDLCLRLELTHPDASMPDGSPGHQFWARDDLGNIYPSDADSHWSDVHLDLIESDRTGPGEWEWVYRIETYDPNAAWIELCYDDGGRNMVLHIDLTGGEDG